MPASFNLTRLPKLSGAGGICLQLSGQLALPDATEFWQKLKEEIEPGRGHEIDLSAVERLDGVCAAMLVSVEAEARCSGQYLHFHGASPGVERLLALYGIDGNPCKAPPTHLRILEQVGEATCSLVANTRNTLSFIGELSLSAIRAIRTPKSVHWADLGKLLERAGADSVPIVIAINLLVGFILGLQSAMQMEQFGVGIYVADLVGMSVVRELGPLMTAIIVTGRSGAAYAAQIGTMVVSEEVSALRSMGFDPVRFLVIPRTIALALMVPLLVVIGNFVGLLGGLLVGVLYLDVSISAYILRTQSVIGLSDWCSGLLKAAVFGIAIALIACERGFSTRGGAEGVGTSTTSAVVTMLFTLVCLDAFFTIIFSALGI